MKDRHYVKLASIRLHSHGHENESGYPCAGYSKHMFGCIPVAAVHISMSTVCCRTSRFCTGPVFKQPIEIVIQCYLFIQHIVKI